ncbi:hypothetical protein [Roseibium limicola]|uniref:Uncharacterized protein n=1 Tax=Roseibium limicola TaxID=2816037 RepID=A0A939EM84_9HYPH|nr:hypothetical protein [Roseibium limicola]MBO0344745.1 hypothetical protein [Roseibium limicola]
MPEPHPVLPETLSQIRQIPASDRPLVVCDVDEVILHLIRPMEAYFADLGLVFMQRVYKLTGNIARRGENVPIAADEVRRHIHTFFDAFVHAQEVVQGAPQALRQLARNMDIILLTNLPGTHNRAARETLLKSADIDYPMITNSGPKGGAVAALSAGRQSPIVFIDDSTVNQASVHASLPTAKLIQFIADDSFRTAHLPADHIDLLSGDWAETTAFIEAIMAQSARDRD